MRRLLLALKVVEALFAINFAAILVVGLILAKEGLLSRERVLAAVKALRGTEEAKPTTQPTTTAPSAPSAATATTLAGLPLADRHFPLTGLHLLPRQPGPLHASAHLIIPGRQPQRVLAAVVRAHARAEGRGPRGPRGEHLRADDGLTRLRIGQHSLH